MRFLLPGPGSILSRGEGQCFRGSSQSPTALPSHPSYPALTPPHPPSHAAIPVAAAAAGYSAAIGGQSRAHPGHWHCRKDREGAVRRERVDARSRWESEVCIGNKRILLLCMDAMAQFGQDGTQAHSRAGGGVASSLCGYLCTQHIRTKMMPLPPPRQHIRTKMMPRPPPR